MHRISFEPRKILNINCIHLWILLKNKMNDYGSLTDKQNYSNQLRFSTKARIERYISYNLLAIKNRFIYTS